MNKKRLGRLSEMELEVMREVWRISDSVTVTHMLEIFSVRYGWKTSTLSTIMDRLIEKEYLSKTMQGKANIYTAIVTETEHKDYETRVFLAEVHNNSIKSLVAALADGSDLTTEEINEIRQWFREKVGDV